MQPHDSCQTGIHQLVTTMENLNIKVKAVSNIRKNIYRSDMQVTFELYCNFRCLHVFYSKSNYIYRVLSHSVDFKALQELWNPLSKAVPCKFHGYVRHSKCNCLQGRANCHRSRAWQIVLIFNTGKGMDSLIVYMLLHAIQICRYIYFFSS